MKKYISLSTGIIIGVILIIDRFFLQQSPDYHIDSTLWIVCFMTVLISLLAEKIMNKKMLKPVNKIGSLIAVLVLAYLIFENVS